MNKNAGKLNPYPNDLVLAARLSFKELSEAFFRFEQLQETLSNPPADSHEEVKAFAARVSVASLTKADAVAKRYMRLVGAGRITVEQIPIDRLIDIMLTNDFAPDESAYLEGLK